MSYATIVRKKIRMCARFGHLPQSVAQRRLHWSVRWRACQRCGCILARGNR